MTESIVKGSLPENYTALAINSLKDLVSLSSKVIHDEEKNVYFSTLNGITYLFDQGE